MKIIAPLASLAVVGLVVLPVNAQKKRQADRRLPTDVSLAGGGGGPTTIGQVERLFCVQRIVDQANGGCLAASSAPTLGMLFPYPGFNNSFNNGGGFIGGGSYNSVSGGLATIGGGNRNLARRLASIGGGSDNAADGYAATIGGGYLNDAAGYLATIGGGLRNSASEESATVGGGQDNSVSEPGGTVGGGSGNFASGGIATVAGGARNVAGGESAAIGGGSGNSATADYATVAGGYQNTGSGRYSAVGGGGGYDYMAGRDIGNTASGDRSTVPGGADNSAAGNYSFAAGREAMADHDGSFVWGDSQTGVASKTTSVADEFNVYASGGARFFSNSAATTGVLLAPGGGSWTAVSSRDMKENFDPVDVGTVLDAVLELPISTWNYKAQSESIRHMGPMAQDFYAAFELGLGETTIDAIDPDGVALAAIQGLHGVVVGEVGALKGRLAEKDAEIAELRDRLERLETLLSQPRQGM